MVYLDKFMQNCSLIVHYNVKTLHNIKCTVFIIVEYKEYNAAH